MLIPPVDHHQIGVERSHIEQAHAHEASAREILEKKKMINFFLNIHLFSIHTETVRHYRTTGLNFE